MNVLRLKSNDFKANNVYHGIRLKHTFIENLKYTPHPEMSAGVAFSMQAHLFVRK